MFMNKWFKVIFYNNGKNFCCGGHNPEIILVIKEKYFNNFLKLHNIWTINAYLFSRNGILLFLWANRCPPSCIARFQRNDRVGGCCPP